MSDGTITINAKPKLDYDAIVYFCAAECHRQRTTAIFVSYMFRAWSDARRHGWKILRGDSTQERLEWLRKIGGAIDPHKNARGFREVDLVFPPDCPRGAAVEFAIAEWIEKEIQDPDEYAYEFLRVHPFADGNGRTAALLYNLRKGTIRTPETLPNFFSEPHRDSV